MKARTIPRHLRMTPYDRNEQKKTLKELVDEFQPALHRTRKVLYCGCCDEYRPAVYIGNYTDNGEIVAKGYKCVTCDSSITRRTE